MSNSLHPSNSCDDVLSADGAAGPSATPLTKHQEKNRRAQRKFRERQKDKLASMEQEVRGPSRSNSKDE